VENKTKKTDAENSVCVLPGWLMIYNTFLANQMARLPPVVLGVIPSSKRSKLSTTLDVLIPGTSQMNASKLNSHGAWI